MSNDLNIFNTAGIGEDAETPRPARFHSGRTADGVDPPAQRQRIAAHSISLSRQDRSVLLLLLFLLVHFTQKGKIKIQQKCNLENPKSHVYTPINCPRSGGLNATRENRDKRADCYCISVKWINWSGRNVIWKFQPAEWNETGCRDNTITRSYFIFIYIRVYLFFNFSFSRSFFCGN